MWEKAKVEMKLIADDLFLGPKDSMTIWWKINPNHVRWFNVAPKPGQSTFPRSIRIDRVRVQVDKVIDGTTESKSYRAYVTITNPDAPKPTEEGWADGCYFKLYVAVAQPA